MSKKPEPPDADKKPSNVIDLLAERSKIRKRRAPVALDPSNPEQFQDWLGGVSEHVDDVLAIAEDALRPLGERYYGRALAKSMLDDTKRALEHSLAVARKEQP